jgi:excisionase family DNA binding protein
MLPSSLEFRRRAHSLTEAAALSNMGVDALRSAIRSGRLTARRFGRRVFVTDDDLRQFLAGLPRVGASSQEATERRA